MWIWSWLPSGIRFFKPCSDIATTIKSCTVSHDCTTFCHVHSSTPCNMTLARPLCRTSLQTLLFLATPSRHHKYPFTVYCIWREHKRGSLLVRFYPTLSDKPLIPTTRKKNKIEMSSTHAFASCIAKAFPQISSLLYGTSIVRKNFYKTPWIPPSLTNSPAYW